MPSSRELPLPEGFSAPRRGRLLLLVLTTPLLLLLPLAGGLVSGNWAQAGGALLLGALLVLSIVNIVRFHLRRTWSLDALRPAPGGIVIGFSRTVVVIRLLGLLFLGAALVLWGLAARSAGWEIGAVAFLVSGAAVLGVLVLRWVQGVRPGELTLTPDSVRLVLGSRDIEVRWDDIRFLHAWEHHDRYRTLAWRRLELPAERAAGWRPARRDESLLAVTRKVPGIDIHCDRVEFDPVLLYHLLRFYLDRPLARPELAGRAVHTRLRDRMFVG